MAAPFLMTNADYVSDAYDYSYVIYFEFDYFLDIYKNKRCRSFNNFHIKLTFFNTLLFTYTVLFMNTFILSRKLKPPFYGWFF